MPLGIELIRIEVNVDGGDEIRNVKFSHLYNATRMLPFPPWSPRQCLMKNYISIGRCEEPKNKELARRILDSIRLCAKKKIDLILISKYISSGCTLMHIC